MSLLPLPLLRRAVEAGEDQEAEKKALTSMGLGGQVILPVPQMVYVKHPLPPPQMGQEC